MGAAVPRPPDHHLCIAYDDSDQPVGFVSGVETTHPDKGTEMFLYELGVDDRADGKGIGRALVEALAAGARAGLLRHVGGHRLRQPGGAGDVRHSGRDPHNDGVVLGWRFG